MGGDLERTATAERKGRLTFVLCVYMAAEVPGGLMFNLALLADAGHMLTDEVHL